jgi:glycosyltransferase involved in cell wall biosynthesis
LSLSLVIEWENASRIGVERARRMLAELHRQLSEPGLVREAELICAHAAPEIDESLVRELMTEDGRSWPATIHFVEGSPGYYEQKNRGAELAKHDIVLFLDSDVIPEPGWLSAILSTFHRPEAGIVGGATMVDHDDLYSAAMALGWIFPLPPEDEDLVQVPGFWANNVAFRRALRESMRFPSTDQYRGQAALLFDQLAAAGQTIFSNHAARVRHPPPDKRAFVVRALWSGYDVYAGAKRKGRLAGALRGPIRDGAFSLLRVKRGFRKVGLGPLGAIGAGGIVASFHLLRVMGFLTAAVAPRWLHSRLRRAAP